MCIHCGIWKSVHDLCVYLYVCNSNFSKVTENQVLVNAVQAQCDNISNLIVLDFWIKALFNVYGMIAHLKCHCGAFQTPQKTNLLTTDLFASWNLDQYNRCTCWQQNYALNKLSYIGTESSILANHNNFGTCSHACSTTRSSNWLSILGCYWVLMLISLQVHCV